jgi:hypothetical protein
MFNQGEYRFKRLAADFCLKSEYLDLILKLNGKFIKIIDLNPQNQTTPVIVQNIESKEKFSISVLAVLLLVDRNKTDLHHAEARMP